MMKKISRIEIVNFQSHSYTDLYLSDGVNVIVGPSDSGKTAIIRAIKWVLFNEPSGSSFIKRGEEYAKVVLYFNDNTIIERGRSKKKNYYILKKDVKEERYEGFGHNVPQDIEEAAEIHKLSINNQNIIVSIADQLESPFLITEAPSVKSTAIGILAGTDIIDKASSTLSKEIYEEKNNLKAQESLLKLQKEELSQYEYLKEEKENLIKIKTIIDKAEFLENRLDKLSIVNQRYLSIVQEIKNTENELSRLKNISELENVLESAIPSINHLKLLSRMSKNKEILEKEERFLTNTITKTNHLEKTEKSILDLEQYIKNYYRLKQFALKWTSLSKNIQKSQRLVNNINIKKINDVENQIEDKLSRYQKLDRFYKDNTILSSRIKNGNIYLERYENLKAIESITENTNNMTEKLKTYIQLRDWYHVLNKNQENILTEINGLNNSIHKMIASYEDILKNITACPYCKSRIDSKHRESIVNEMRDDYGL